jgi:hypothetical protein
MYLKPLLDRVTIFLTSFFAKQLNLAPYGPFRIWIRILEDIRVQACTDLKIKHYKKQLINCYWS